MQIIKPKRLGLINKTYQLGAHQFSVAALAFFPLGDKCHLLEENKQWLRCGSQLPLGNVLDMGFIKPRGEVLVSAQAYSHLHGLVKNSRPGFKLASLEKRVAVNKKKVRSALVDDFLPVDIMDNSRSRYNGTYNEKWLKTIHPGFPLDTDPRLFNAAPKDQQLKKGYFTPGEKYSLYDMYPGKAKVEGCIPNINVRIFINQMLENKETFKELGVNLETLWFFPEVNTGLAIYRGVAEVGDSDGLDVKQLLMACENPDADPRPLSYYENVLELRTTPETALGHLFNEAQLMPQKSIEEEHKIKLLYKEALDEQNKIIEKKSAAIKKDAAARINKVVAGNFPGKDKLDSSLTSKPEFSQAEDEISTALNAIPPIPESLVKAGDFDLSPMIEKTREVEKKIQAKVEKQQAEMEKMAAEYKAKYKQQKPEEGMDLKTLKEKVFDRVFVCAVDLREKNKSALSEDKLKTFLEQVPASTRNKMIEEGRLDLKAVELAQQHMAMSRRQARQNAPESMRNLEGLQAHSDTMRAWVEALLAKGESLAGMDLAGANLTALDFSGQDLRDTMLEEADLRKCNFAHAQMNGAVLVEARLDGAIFDGACLDNANLSKSQGSDVSFCGVSFKQSLLNAVSLRGSDFSDSVFEHCLAQEADLRDSLFQRVMANECVFSMANLEQSIWREARVSAGVFMQAKIALSNWSGAKMERCVLLKISARGVNFSRTELEKVQFSNVGDLREADFSNSICKVCGFRGIDLSGLKAPYAVFVECDFSEAKLYFASFEESLFKDCMMMQMDMQESDCRSCWFNSCTLRKSKFRKVDFHKANFHHCNQDEVVCLNCKTRSVKQYPSGRIA